MYASGKPEAAAAPMLRPSMRWSDAIHTYLFIYLYLYIHAFIHIYISGGPLTLLVCLFCRRQLRRCCALRSGGPTRAPC